ncbi:MAG: LacI family DNA-binding transcriptional regulator [Corynebacterium sp.]|nr:LacI family DNA-binding transcriptional regulator [Corynebacterium sp.]
MPKPRPSLNTVAEAVGVSRTTVSNAYNHPEHLSEELRNRIFAAANKLGYPGPHPGARSLRTQQYGSIGVLFTDDLTYAFEDAASVDFLAGLAYSAAGHSTSMTLIPVGPETATKQEAQALIHSSMVDGFVIYSVACDDPYLAAISASKRPAVLCDQPNDHRLPFVGIDDAAAIAPAAHALIAAGHRRIGILCIRLDSTPNNGPVSPERLAKARHHVQRGRVDGALEIFAAAGIPREQTPVVERYLNTPAENEAAAAELMERYPECTAILCTTDTMALGALEYAARRDWSVPHDLSVTGFDGIALARERNLATIVQPNQEKGRQAGRILHGEMAHEKQPRRTLLETTWLPGTTIGPPPTDGENRQR